MYLLIYQYIITSKITDTCNLEGLLHIYSHCILMKILKVLTTTNKMSSIFYGLNDNKDNSKIFCLGLFPPTFRMIFSSFFIFQSHIIFYQLCNMIVSRYIYTTKLYVSYHLTPFLDHTKMICFGIIYQTKLNTLTCDILIL